MRKKGTIAFVISTFLILFFAYTLLNGLDLGNYRVKPLKSLLSLGLDLKGGVYIEEEAVGQVSKEDLERTRQLLDLRINNLGVKESTIAIVPGVNRIRIEIPGIYNAKSALDAIGKTGELKFIGPDNNVILTGKDVADATVGVDQRNNQPVVQLKLKDEGTKKFAEATAKFKGQQIAIYMDDDMVSNPTVQDVITGGEAIITGSKDIEEAKRLAGIIKSGALPVKISPATVETIGPTLGAEAIPTSKKAAVVGVSLVMIFMLLYYKIPGLIADLALIVYMILTGLIFVSINATLTLPGIAGLLLSIGMAVDANVLIFERIKEELNLGKSLKTAVDLGFHRAFTSIFDSQITTLIAGFVLYFLGSGSVKGFALTLNIGVLCSLLTAVTITRFLLKSFVNSGIITNVKFYKPSIK